MKLELLLRLGSELRARELLHHEREHRLAEISHLLAFLAEVEAEVEVVFLLELFVGFDLLRQVGAAVVDEGANHAKAEIGPSRRRIEILRALTDERDREQVTSVGRDQVIFPEELEISADLLPLVARTTRLELARLLVDLLAQRSWIDPADELEERRVVRIVSLEQRQKATDRALEILATRLLGIFLQDRVDALRHVEIVRLDQDSEEMIDTGRHLPERVLRSLPNAEAWIGEERRDRGGDLRTIRALEAIEDVDMHREVRRLLQEVDELRQGARRNLHAPERVERVLRDILPVFIAEELRDEPMVFGRLPDVRDQPVERDQRQSTDLGEVLLFAEVLEGLVGLLQRLRRAEVAHQDQTRQMHVEVTRVRLASKEPLNRRIDRRLLGGLHLRERLAEALRDVLGDLERRIGETLEEELQPLSTADRRERRDDGSFAVEVGVVVELLELRGNRRANRRDDDHRVIADHPRREDQRHDQIRHIASPELREPFQRNELHRFMGFAEAPSERLDDRFRGDPDLCDHSDGRDAEVDITRFEKRK